MDEQRRHPAPAHPREFIPATQQRVVLTQRPTGLLTWDDVSLRTDPVPELQPGEALLEHHYLGIDATVRSWLNPGPGYLPPVEIGETVRAATVGRVVASKCPAHQVGDVVTSLTGWQDYGVIRDDLFSTNLGPQADQPAVLALYGSTGATAYFGMVDHGHPRPGETVVVSAAAGATGSVAGQIARILGARVIGICGSAEKCRYVVDELGFDGAINHRTDDVAARLKELCPKRVDVYFDNVGGPILDAVLGRIADGARVVLCGAISVYNAPSRQPGPANYLNLIQRGATMVGFLALNEVGRFPEAIGALQAWVASGDLRHRAHFYEGLSEAVDALNALFTGENIGKVMIRMPAAANG